MVVRTWRKISAPGRLGQNTKHSPTSGVHHGDRATSVSPSYENASRIQASRRTVARELFYTQGCHQKNKDGDDGHDSTTGELAINCLLLEFSSYARCKIEKALKTVKGVEFL